MPFEYQLEILEREIQKGLLIKSMFLDLKEREDMSNKEEGYREISHPTIDDVQMQVKELEAENAGLERKITSFKTGEKRRERWLNRLGLVFAAVISIGSIGIGASHVYKSVLETKNHEADTMLKHSKSEVIREKVIADRFALDSKQKKAAKIAEDKRIASVQAFNKKYVTSVFKASEEWARKNQSEGIYSCNLKVRPLDYKLSDRQWVDCKIYRDFKSTIKLRCSRDECGGAQEVK